MQPSHIPVLSLIVPCYNEEEGLQDTLHTLKAKLDEFSLKGVISDNSYILCVDDGSTDNTWSIIEQHHALYSDNIKAISLAHNSGHQNALLAGLMTAVSTSDIAITIDADLQDDLDKIESMINLHLDEQLDIVYGIRSKRPDDSWFKRTTANAFYTLQHHLGLETISNHADFRLMSKKAIELLAQYGESNLYLRGIVPLIGLKSAMVEYQRKPRTKGHSKYNMRRMFNLSVDGITSFTTKPIRLIFMLGLFIMLINIAVGIYVFISYFAHSTISGWTSLMLSVWFLGSLILMSIGVVGEYIGKIFNEVKHRPRYAIKAELR